MGLILRQKTTENSGNTLSIKGSALSYAEGDGNFMYLLSNMSGSNINIIGSTEILGNFQVGGNTFSNTAVQIRTSDSSPTGGRLLLRTDNTGYYFGIGKNVNGTVTDLIKIGDSNYNNNSVSIAYNLGIGINYPTEPLHINNGANYIKFGGLGSNNAYIRAYESTFNVGNEYGGNLNLFTNNTTKVTITSDGFVGIGTTSPRNAFEIAQLAPYNGSSYVTTLRIGGITPGDTAATFRGETSRHQIVFSSWRDSQVDAIGSKIVSINRAIWNDPDYYAVQQGTLAFYTGNVNYSVKDSTVERLRITSDPYTGQTAIGINTTTPSASLHVSGTVMFPNLTATSSVSNVVMINTTTGQLYYTASSAIASSSIGGGNVTGSGVANYISMWSGSTSLTTSSLYQSSSNVGIGVTSFDGTNPEKLLVSGSTINTIVGKANINSYTQLNITNKNVGSSASSDVVATNDTGTENGNFINMGINSSTFNGTIGAANDAYLYNTGSTLWIGNTSPGISGSIKFFAGNNATTTAMMISSSGYIGIGTTTPSSSLDVNGDLTVKHIVGKTGPLAVTLSTGAGTGATYSITGSDLAGVITVTTGTSPAANATIVLLNYFAGLTSPGYPLITPANLNSSVLNGSGASGAKQVYVDTGANPSISFTIKSSTTGLTAGTIYKWYYHIMQ
jgi:hypothetical protein